MKVMVVEDEKDIREILCTLLSDEGFSVVPVESGVGIADKIRNEKPDLLLLDQILPEKSGAEVIKELKAAAEFRQIPIIMVTGLSSENDKVAALDLGADDYITKPFYARELTARVKAVARRADVRLKKQQPPIVRDNLTIDFAGHRVLLRGKEVPLTLTEFKILSELVKEDGQVLSRELLRERALGNLNVTDRTIDVHMASLRKKLEELGDNIETVRGVGYRFANPA